MKKVLMIAMAAACAAAFAQEAKKDAKQVDPAKAAAQAEKRAERMVKTAVGLIADKEEDRGVGMLEAVARMYPDSQAKYAAALELGRHFTGKRDFERALIELKKAFSATNDETRAESLLLQGELYVAKNQPGEAAMVFRRITQDFPTSDFANDAFFKIGQIHFAAGRWARASEAFEMVGTAVPASADTNSAVLAESGQRIYVHVTDKDLAVLAAMGEKSKVKLLGSDGDEEVVELAAFGKGDGDFIASCKTTVAPSAPPYVTSGVPEVPRTVRAAAFTRTPSARESVAAAATDTEPRKSVPASDVSASVPPSTSNAPLKDEAFTSVTVFAPTFRRTPTPVILEKSTVWSAPSPPTTSTPPPSSVKWDVDAAFMS
jgi:predicted negative regulator of RcsB-dependent stress response